ncbi:AMP-binding protein [Caballeronia sp. BR00000012568055]|uniref:AMP-binding protein n=1 Tax=Caballeronia sp. BR00000012568055 TaxID=2918761 RepID=UPI0023F8A46E|nr:AMP-binding protein [Caballeronia sp. BR00000012568055]
MPTTFPLVFHASPDQTIAWRNGERVSVRAFLADVRRVAAALPDGGHVFNVCADRYRFTVSLCATLVAGKTSLLPSTHTPEMVRALASFAPDAFCLHDNDDCAIDLPRFRYPDSLSHSDDKDEPVPQIDAARIVAYVFTSGSTGAPVPHRKTWGFLVKNVRAAADRLGLLDVEPATLIGTVPPQHMYGFESTVLLAMLGGIAFSNRQPFYPVDIRAELAAVPERRVLVSSPIHLRALSANADANEDTLPRAALVLSATAPLAEKLAVDTEARLHAPLMEIYGSTETGQIATRRTAQTAAWELFPDIVFTPHANDDGDGQTMWASGGHVEVPVPMGDALELIDDTHFLLHGRKADLINIAGKRTSLAYLNHQLNAVPGVVDGVFYMPDDSRDADAVQRLMALVVAPGLNAADVQRALRERIDAAFMPRPLMFVDTLPRNATGKLPREVLTHLIEQERAKKAALSFTIDAAHPALAGHFPGRPIVPGVVLLDHALDAIGHALGTSFDACKIESAKFLSPASPGETLDVAFESAASGAIRFTIRAGERAVASGSIGAKG